MARDLFQEAGISPATTDEGRDLFAEAGLVQPEPAETPKDRSWLQAAADTGLDLAKGVVGVGESAVGIADLATGNLVGKGLSAVGYDPAQTKEFLSSGYSDSRQQANRNVHNAKGFVDTTMALVDNPSAAVGSMVESAPMMLGTAGAARMVAARMLQAAGITAGTAEAAAFLSKPSVIAKLTGIGSATEGALTAGSIQEQGRQAGRDYTDTAPSALAGGAITGAIGFGTSKIPGFKDAEVGAAIAGMGGGGARQTLLSAGKEIAKGTFKEGVLEELPQSAQEQVFTNLALGKHWAEGVPEAAAQGMVAGAGMGGGMTTYSEGRNALSQTNNTPAASTQSAPPGVTPPVTQPAQPGAPGQGAGGSQPTQEAPTAAEKALRAPVTLTALDRVNEIDTELQPIQQRLQELTPENGYGPAFDQERMDLAGQAAVLDQERSGIAATWPKAAKGAPTTFSTEAGVRLGAEYALMEADDLVTSHDEGLKPNPLYPAELQPRERDRAASSMQVMSIVQKLDPARLGFSADAATGAPIVGADGLVESGNARTIALKRVYLKSTGQGDSEIGATAHKYREFLIDNAAQFGLTPESVNAMAKPVLVRVRSTPVNRAEFARQANASTVAAMSPSEQAKSDANRIDSMEDLTPDDNGDFSNAASRPFVNRFVARLPMTEQAGMMDSKGNLSTSGYARVRNAVLAKAYGDSPVLARMTESMDDNLRNVSRAFMLAAPKVAAMRSAIKAGNRFDADITPDLMAASEELARIKADGGSVADALSQTDIMGDQRTPEARQLLQFMSDNMRRPRQMADFISAYMDALEEFGDPKQGSMFDDAQAPTKQDLLKAAGKAIGNEEQLNGPASQGAGAQAAGQAGQKPGNAPGGGQGTAGDGAAAAAASASKGQERVNADGKNAAQGADSASTQAPGKAPQAVAGNAAASSGISATGAAAPAVEGVGLNQPVAQAEQAQEATDTKANQPPTLAAGDAVTWQVKGKDVTGEVVRAPDNHGNVTVRATGAKPGAGVKVGGVFNVFMAKLVKQPAPKAPPAPPVAGVDHAKDFSIRPVEITESLMASGAIKALHKAAGVKSADAFGALPVESQANAYAKFVTDGGTPAPAATEDYNDKVMRIEREAVVTRLQSDREVNQANGKPFKTEASANEFSTKYELGDTHKVVKVEGGYTLQRLGDAQRPSALKASADRRANDPEVIRQEAAFSKAKSIGTAADAAVAAYENGDTSIDEFEKALKGLNSLTVPNRPEPASSAHESPLKPLVESVVQPAAEGKPVRQYHLVAVNEKTGAKTPLTRTPMTHAQAVTNKSKFDDKPGRRIELEEYFEPDNENDSGTRLSRAPSADIKNLVTLHNLTAENLLHAQGMGGIPVPSIGITKVDSAFGGFGEITLIAPKGMIDPEDGVPVFDRDAYTARFPTMNFKKVLAKKADAFYERMVKVRDLGFDGGFVSQVWDAIKNASTQNPDKVWRVFQQYDAPRLLYAKDVLGKDVKIPMKPVSADYPWVADKQFSKTLASLRDTLMNYASSEVEASPEMAELSNAARAAIERYADRNGRDDDADVRNDVIEALATSWGDNGKWAVDAAKSMPWKSLDRIFTSAKNVGKTEVDKIKLSSMLDKLVPTNSDAYNKWAMGLINPLFDAPTITLRGKEVEPTLQNIVDSMTTGAVSGAEKTMTSGPGKIAALLGKRFKSIAQIQAARDQVVSESVEKTGKEATDKVLQDYRDRALPFFTEKDWRGQIDTWGGMDAAMEALAVAGKAGSSEAAIRSALSRKGFKNVDQTTVGLARAAIDAIRNTATNYFEAKPQRAVKLNEFRGAVVPKGTSQEVLDVLAANGVEVITYKAKDAEAKSKAVEKLARKVDKAHGDVMFSRGVAPQTEGMDVDVLQAIASRNQAKLPNLPDVVVLATAADAPAALRDYIQLQGAMGDVEGAMHDGKLYLFASGLSDPLRAEHVLVEHEAAHFGLRAILGDSLKTTMQAIYNTNGAVRKAAIELKKRGKLSEAEAAEEVIVDMPSSKLIKLQGWRKLTVRVRDWLAGHGFEAMAAKLSNWLDGQLSDQQRADLFVADLVRAARGYVAGKQAGGRPVAGTMLSGTLAEDWQKQEKWLQQEAQARGYKDIDTLAEKNYPLFEKLADLWRKKNPADNGVLLSRGKNSPMTNTNVVGNQGGRSADDSTPGDVTDFSKPSKKWGELFFGDATTEKVSELQKWLKQNPNAKIRMYHGTSILNDIKNQGVLRTSSSRKNSLQSGAGYSYWSIYPGQAKTFGEFGSANRGSNSKGEKVAVYFTDFSVSELLADVDQLKNRRQFAGDSVGNTLAESLVYGKGARVKADVSANRVNRYVAKNEFTAPDSGGAALSRAPLQGTADQRAEQIIQTNAATAKPVDALVRKLTQITGIERVAGSIYNGDIFRLMDRIFPPLKIMARADAIGQSSFGQTIKAGMVSDYGVPDAVIDQRAMMQGRQRVQLRKAGALIEKLSTLTRAESRIAYEWMNETDPHTIYTMMQNLPDESVKVLMEVQAMIDNLSKEAVRMGQLSAEAYERNKFAYLRRSYAKYTLGLTESEKKGRARAISVLGEQYKGRGLTESAAMKQVQNSAPDWWQRKMVKGKADVSLKGEKLIRLERHAPSGQGTTPLPGMTGKQLGKLLEVHYFPAGVPLPAKYADWTQGDTFEVRDIKGDNLILWRDFTKDERENMGEIDEARFAIAKTLHAMVHDVEVGRYLEWLAHTQAKKEGETIPGVVVNASERYLDTFKPGEWVRVPETKIPGTSVLKYGKLSGRYLPGPVWNDLRQTVNGQFKPFGDTYAKILSFWKTAKTALSPGVHTNNIMSNFVMADWHDVTAGHTAKALRIIMGAHARDGKGMLGGAGNLAAKGIGMVDRESAAAIMTRYLDSGGNIGSWATNEIANKQIEPLLAAMEAELAATAGNSAQAQVGVMTALQHLRHGEMTSAWEAAKGSKPGKLVGTEAQSLIDLYQSEDEVFRLASWLKAKEEGKTDLEAGKIARRSFMDYNINAPWVQAMRNSALPFVSYTYRAVPMMLEIAATKPHKLMKLMLLAGAVNALGVLLSGSDDDEERKLLPEEKAGRIWGMVPKLIRMPWNDANSSPVFLDVRRFVPVGDVLDVGQGHSAIPLLPMMTPGGPLVMIAEVVLNKTGFTGKPITLETDTPEQKAIKVADYLYKAFMPNVLGLPNTYATTGVANAAGGKTDAFGREQSVAQAMASSFGVKLASYPADVLRKNLQSKAQAEIMEIDRNISALKRQRQNNSITTEEFQKLALIEQEKKRKVAQELRDKLN